MTGGSLNLASAKGMAEDVINLNPQITFFKKVYKRHTNFGIESIQQDLNTTMDFGSRTDIKITKTGTLISDMHMEFTLPPPARSGGVDGGGNPITATSTDGIIENFDTYATYVDAVGFAIIEEIKLLLNNDTVDKHTGLWYDVWNELTDPNQKEWPLVGKTNSKTPPSGGVFNKSRYYVPLKFYFNSNPGLAIPIFLLNEGDVKISVALKSRESVLRFKKQTGVNAQDTIIRTESISNFKFFTTYIFLEPSEEMRITNNLPSEYLVETLDIHDNVASNDLNSITFENPVKEIIWVFRHNDRLTTGSAENAPAFNNIGETNPNDIFNYSNVSINTNLDYGSYDTFNTLTLSIGNQERISSTDATFFRTMQPYKYHSNTPGGISQFENKKYIYVYSFALSPEEYQPSGSYNFSALDEKTNFEFSGADLTNYKLTIFSIRYEYISFTRGRVSKSNVPIQKASESSNLDAGIQQSSGTGSSVSSDSRVARRAVCSVPKERCSGPKEFWSGLQGQFFKS